MGYALVGLTFFRSRLAVQQNVHAADILSTMS